MTTSTPNDRLLARLQHLGDVDARGDEPLAPHTTYKVGGPARRFVTAHTLEALQAVLSVLRSVDEPALVLGHGSNVLFSDAGFPGTVLTLGRDLSLCTLTRDAFGPGVHLLEAGGGCSVTRLLRLVKQEAVAGVEFLGGIPATLGGAVRMNAGTREGEVKDALVAAQIVRPDVAPVWVTAAELGLSYRHSALPEGAVVTAARFRVTDASPEMRERLDRVLAYRKATQPLHLPSCGSVFANPEGDSAGRLIDAAGLKGRTLGGAQVSEQHANWIVNLGAATASDVRSLIALCQDEVQRQFGVHLRPEVQILGDWGDWAGWEATR
ncbi:MAG: UDP-N-acetylmuramate dehydrogenase [Deltaproteobacteria bacterium]|nr:MAG: UDP-N-acetylmuramate dehydrogenase [Deltaproteobacteria bacterium]